MKRSLHERTKEFFICMGQKGKLLKILAIAGLAVSMLLHRFFIYLRGGFDYLLQADFGRL